MCRKRHDVPTRQRHSRASDARGHYSRLQGEPVDTPPGPRTTTAPPPMPQAWPSQPGSRDRFAPTVSALTIRNEQIGIPDQSAHAQSQADAQTDAQADAQADDAVPRSSKSHTSLWQKTSPPRSAFCCYRTHGAEQVWRQRYGCILYMQLNDSEKMRYQVPNLRPRWLRSTLTRITCCG